MAATKLYLLCVLLISSFKYIEGDYIASVVEYQPSIQSTPNSTVEQNLQQYVFYIEKAKESNAQIIVFPEYGLTGIVVDPSGYAINIPNAGNGTEFENYWLQKLSNAAKSNALYIVVNLLEKSLTEANKTIYYNTNIVFDKSGKIVAKYRKINLFSEPELTPGVPEENQITFTTDFGITFGVFTCFDISSDNPSRTILSNNVTDIVYPTSWNSYLPFLHSLTTQVGYAIANNVNLLAAGLDMPEVGIGGSGIWGSDGTAFTHYISGTAGTKQLIATVKNTPTMKVLGDDRTPLKGFNNLDDGVSSIEKYNASRYFEDTKYKFKTIDLSQVNISDEVCHKSFCCQFTINVSYVPIKSEEVYKIMAYDGPLEILTAKKFHKICSLVGCATSDVNTCGKNNIQLTTKFQRISVSTSISDSDEHYRPMSLATNLIPIFNSTFNKVIENHAKKVVYRNLIEQSNVLAFGILEVNSSAGTIICNTIVLLFIFIANRIFV